MSYELSEIETMLHRTPTGTKRNLFSAPRSLAAACLLVWAILPDTARANLTICNDSFDVINFAIGLEDAQGFATEGWWTVGPNRCATVRRGALESRFFYVFASDVFGQPLLEGVVEMCVREGRFNINGIDACWQRGHIAARFAEIDTGAATQYVLVLGNDPPASE